MSLGKIKFEDGREVELIEVQDDVIIIEKEGKDGTVKQYRLKKTSEMYAGVADQVEALTAGEKKVTKKEIKVKEPDEVEVEAPVKAEPKKKTAKKEPEPVVEDEADDEEVEEAPAPKVEAKPAKKKELPAKKKELPAIPTKVVKLDYLYDWDEQDSYQALTINIENVKNANDAAKYFFTCENEREIQAVIFMLNADRVQTITKTANLNIYNIKAHSDTIAVKDRAKETDFVALTKLFDKLTDDDNSALIPEIVKYTAPVDEKSIYIAFDKDATKKVLGFLEKNLKELVAISDSIANKLLK